MDRISEESSEQEEKEVPELAAVPLDANSRESSVELEKDWPDKRSDSSHSSFASDTSTRRIRKLKFSVHTAPEVQTLLEKNFARNVSISEKRENLKRILSIQP